MTQDKFLHILIIILVSLVILLLVSIWNPNTSNQNTRISVTPNYNDSDSKSLAINIALNDNAVKGLLDGHKYIVNNVMWAGEQASYNATEVFYPVVEFLVYKDQSNDTDIYVRVAVNLDNKHINIQSQREFYDYPPPDFPK